MMIDFWADWCQPCKMMDAEVYVDPALRNAVNRKIVAVRINFDIQKDLTRAYNVQAIPQLVFTNSLGTELIHHRGFLNAKDLTSVVNALPADVSELNRFDGVLQRDQNDFESLLAMSRMLRVSGFFESSSEYFRRAAGHEQARRSVKEREIILRELGLNYLELRDGRSAARTFERCLRDIPANESTPGCLLNLARAYTLDKQKAKAETTLKKLAADYPRAKNPVKPKRCWDIDRVTPYSLKRQCGDGSG